MCNHPILDREPIDINYDYCHRCGEVFPFESKPLHWTDRPITKPFAWFGAVVFLACIGLAIYGWVSGGMGGAAPPHRTDSTTAEPAE